MYAWGTRGALCGAVTAILLTGCTASAGDPASPDATSGSTSQADSWPGSATDAGNGDSVRVGTWKGKPGLVKITCSGDPSEQVTAVVEAPGGWKATTTQPSGGGDAPVKIEDAGGKSLEVQPQGDAAVRWGVSPTFGTGFSMRGRCREW